MKKTTVNSKILTILICLLTLLPSAAKAQVGFDAVSIEAYIKDHKQQRSLLLVRSTLEASNKLLHDYSGDANLGFRDINKELDKYTRAFDVIDILYQSLRTSLNVYSTYENVSDKVGDYRKMLNDFRKKCLERGNIMSTDTLICIPAEHHRSRVLTDSQMGKEVQQLSENGIGLCFHVESLHLAL